ncbi:hypothetical protein B0H13DRAFT_2362818 [Mycena leptocephala]|nr:hypothetical protein B0H13DRAFT_2362818 [Mycena leptocephala]
MSTRRVAASKTRKASDTYWPGSLLCPPSHSRRQSLAEKKESHRKAAASYYARHPEIKGKNRLSLQKCREATKAKRRQWAPPKKGKAAAPLSDRLSRWSSSFDLNLVTNELLNGPIHFKDPRGAPTSEDEDSDFCCMDAQRRVQTETSKRTTSAQSSPLMPTPDEHLAIEDGKSPQCRWGFGRAYAAADIGASFGASFQLSTVDSGCAGAAQRRPADDANGSGAALLGAQDVRLLGQYLQYRQFNMIDEWCKQVSQLRVEDD